jgi:N-acetylmuramoyl-L-alanine amidase
MTGKLCRIYIAVCACFGIAAILALAIAGRQEKGAGKVPEETEAELGADAIRSSLDELFVYTGDAAQEQLSLRLPEEIEQEQVTIDEKPVERQIIISVKKPEKTALDDRYFYQNPIEGSIQVDAISIENTGQEVKILLTLPDVYAWEEAWETSDSEETEQTETQGEEGNQVLKLLLVHPQEKYDKIVVLDAGHGGDDDGMIQESAEDGQEKLAALCEKDIALRVVLAAGETLEQQGIKVYYTRTEDENPTEQARVTLANSVQADMLVSIHADSSEDTSLYGMRTLYNGTYFIPEFSSADLAYLLLEKAAAKTNEKAIGFEADQGQIYLLQNAMVPVTQLNIGYLSNRQEQKLLEKDDYIERIAEGVADGVLAAYEQME